MRARFLAVLAEGRWIDGAALTIGLLLPLLWVTP